MKLLIRCLLVMVFACVCAADEPTPRELKVDDVPVQVIVADSQFTAGAGPLLGWIRRSADIVTHYYGRFPVRELRIRIQPASGAGVQGGTTFGHARGRPGGF